MYKKFTLGLHWKIALPILIFLFLLGFINKYDQVVEDALLKEFDLSKSKNPEASKAFIMMLKNATYVERLHTFFDYDSIFIKPFIDNMDEYYYQGTALLPAESVEDIYWWTVGYQSIYGLSVPDRNDYSMAKYQVLSHQEFKLFHKLLYRKIIRYFEGNIDFNLPIIKKTRFQYWNVLLSYYRIKFNKTYAGRDLNKKFYNYLNDDESSIIIHKLMILNKEFSEKYLNFSDNPEAKYRYMLTQFGLSLEDAKRAVASSGTRLPQNMCHDNNTQTMMKYLRVLTKYVKKSSSSTAKLVERKLFLKGYPASLLLIYEKSCNNLSQELQPIVQWIRDNYNHKRMNPI